MEVPAEPGLTILAYVAEPGSLDEQALEALSSWAATRAEQPVARDRY